MNDLAERQRQAEKLSDAYSDDVDFIEREFQVPALDELLSRDGVLAVARLIELGNEELHTFVYYSNEVVITTVRGETSLWYSIPQFARFNGSPDISEMKAAPFVAADAIKRSKTLSLLTPRVPKLIGSWQSLTATAAAAPSCRVSCLDGISYRHRVRAPGIAMDAKWSNPNKREHLAQFRLLNAYHELLELVDLFPEERKEAERKKFRKRKTKLARKKRESERKKSS